MGKNGIDLECSTKILKLLLKTSLDHYCENNFIQVMPFLITIFFQESTVCHAVAANPLSWRPRMERKCLF